MLKTKKELRLEEVEKEVLEKILRFNYTNLQMVNEVVYFVNKLWTMKNGEVRTLENHDITIKCKITLNGYDDVIQRFILD